MLAEPLRSRLAHQLDALDMILRGASPEDLGWRPADGRWSALENLAHAARHQEVLRQRLERILKEDRPWIARYRAEDDEDWPAWTALPALEVLRRLARGRRALLAWLDALPADRLARTGEHPRFGVMAIPDWLEFFLVHEAHHLYTALGRLGEARRARG